MPKEALKVKRTTNTVDEIKNLLETIVEFEDGTTTVTTTPLRNKNETKNS